MEYRKLLSGEAVKGFAAGVVVILLPLLWQVWSTSDLEYRHTSRDSYLYSPLRQQGLSMAYEGKPLKNISVVEYAIINRTSKQFGDVVLMFSWDDSKGKMTLVSSGIITPRGFPHDEMVEELSAKDIHTKIFRLKVIPKQRKAEFFRVVFVFDGEVAPDMSIASFSKDVAIGTYKEWKDTANAWLATIPVIALAYTIMFTALSLFQHIIERRRHQKSVWLFGQHASELREQGMLKSADEQAIGDAITVYASFTRPKPHKVWSKIFGTQRFNS